MGFGNTIIFFNHRVSLRVYIFMKNLCTGELPRKLQSTQSYMEISTLVQSRYDLKKKTGNRKNA